MKRLKKALALVLALAAIICMPVHASAAQESNSYGIDFSKTASVDIYKYDLTSAEKDGVWNSSYVSTGVRDEDGVESILGNTQIVNQLTGNGESYGYAIKGVEFSYIKVAVCAKPSVMSALPLFLPLLVFASRTVFSSVGIPVRFLG